MRFDPATNRTIELIDVLWLKRHSVVAAFEIECTTTVYSGLLRMSDLLALQPNIQIPLYLVAPDDRSAKVEQELMRPTFALLDPPLNRICGFVPFSKLMDEIRAIRQRNCTRHSGQSSCASSQRTSTGKMHPRTRE